MIIILVFWAIGLTLAQTGRETKRKSTQPVRGIWVWKTQAEKIITDKDARAVFFDFCKKPHGHAERAITSIFLHADPARLHPSDPCLPGFLRIAHNLGFTVEYLCGTPEWATESHRANGEDRTRLFLEFNRNLPASQRFDGIHFDVEPYTLDDWPQNPYVYWAQYIELLKNCKKQLVDYNAQVRPNITFACDIPCWYDTDDADQSASGSITSHQEIQKIVDYVVVMDYRDKADEIIEDAQEEIEYGQTLGRPVVIGILTGVPKNGVPQNTFLEEGHSYMEEQLALVARSLRPYVSFKGFAFHDDEDYRALLLKEGIPKSDSIFGINEKSAYLVYYGEWNEDRVEQAKKFDLVVLHPNTNITAAWIAEIKNGPDGKSSTPDDVIVLGYISLGEDDVEPPRQGDGFGPGGYASWYMDKTAPKGVPDKNGQWGSYYVDAGNAKWQMFIKQPPPAKDSPVGSDDIIYKLGCDGLFLDTIDTASPWGNYRHTAGGMSFLIKILRIWYPDKILVTNRGLFYYSPHKKDGIDYTTWSPREYINGVMFECYYTEWDWEKNRGLISPLFPDNNKTVSAKELNNAASGPYGFTVLCLDYLSPKQPDYQRMRDVQIHETIVQQKWLDYIGDILLNTMRTDVLDYLNDL